MTSTVSSPHCRESNEPAHDDVRRHTEPPVSAQAVESRIHDQPEDHHADGHLDDGNRDAPVAADQVEVRRNAAVSVVIGAAASAIAIAYLWRAVGSGAPLDWLLCLVMGAMAVGFLRSLLDSRTPLLVADEMGVRIRLGTQWRGLPWEAIDRVMVRPRRGILQDGRLILALHHPQRAVEGFDGRARRHAQLNQKMYGAALAVPLGLTTRVNGGDAHGDDLANRVTALSQGRAEVVTLLDEPSPRTATSTSSSEPVTTADERPVFSDDEPPVTDRRPRWLRRAQEAADADPADHADETEPSTDRPAPGDPTDQPAPDARRLEAPEEAPATLGTFRVVEAVDPVEERASKVRAIAE